MNLLPSVITALGASLVWGALYQASASFVLAVLAVLFAASVLIGGAQEVARLARPMLAKVDR